MPLVAEQKRLVEMRSFLLYRQENLRLERNELEKMSNINNELMGHADNPETKKLMWEESERFRAQIKIFNDELNLITQKLQILQNVGKSRFAVAASL